MPFVKRGGRKLVIAAGGAETGAPVRYRVDNAMVKALTRAFRWRKLLENGVHGTIEPSRNWQQLKRLTRLMAAASSD